MKVSYYRFKGAVESMASDEKKIAEFDKKHPELDDPGRIKKAPYHKEHMFAEKVEKLNKVEKCVVFLFNL